MCERTRVVPGAGLSRPCTLFYLNEMMRSSPGLSEKKKPHALLRQRSTWKGKSGAK